MSNNRVKEMLASILKTENTSIVQAKQAPIEAKFEESIQVQESDSPIFRTASKLVGKMVYIELITGSRYFGKILNVVRLVSGSEDASYIELDCGTFIVKHIIMVREVGQSEAGILRR